MYIHVNPIQIFMVHNDSSYMNSIFQFSHSWKIEVACVNIFRNVAFGVHDYQNSYYRENWHNV
jgi:hypothetical protein